MRGQGAHKGRPYEIPFDCNDPMYMIRHHDEGIQFDVGKSVSQFVPPSIDHPSCIIQPHVSIFDFAEEMFPIVGTDGDKIRAVLGIIISVQPDRSAAAFVGDFVRIGHASSV